MKRRNRKSKTNENASNGHNDENGDAKEVEEAENKRRKMSKNKSPGKKAKDKEDQNAEDLDVTDKDVDEPEEKRRKSKSKTPAKKPAKDDEDEEPQYEVEQILDEKNIGGVRHYLIRWKGYEPESDTWEPESTLNCSELINEFKLKQKRKNKSPKKKPIRGGPKTQETWDENEIFEVDRIVDVYFKKNGEREFLVSWKGYPQSQSSWEPEENMDCKDLIKKFMERVQKAKEMEQRELRVNPAHTDRLTLLSDGHLGRRLSKRNLGKQRVHYHDAE